MNTIAAQLTAQTCADVAAAGLELPEVLRIIDIALQEDLGGGVDVTSQATIEPGHRAVVDLVVREPGVLCGAPVAQAVFDAVASGNVTCEVLVAEGERVESGTVAITVSGSTRHILTAERTALNLMGRMSGVATLTRRWVDEVEGTGASVRDTRKTTPGLRSLEKYAVRCGGGLNHRMSLNDAALIKDNHVAAAGGVAHAFDLVRGAWRNLSVEVEVDSLEQLAEVLAAGADLVLLDNFDIAQLREAVQINDGRARLEASGGLTLRSARQVAQTGVDYLAVGALTHSAPVLDIGADYREAR